MKRILLIFNFIVTILSIVYFKKIEFFLVENNFSWTFSKIFPYVLSVILGIIFSYLIFKVINNKVLKLSFSILFFLLPFLISFILHPIYQGDFSREGSVFNISENDKDINDADLIVLTIPGCPFCHESTFYTNKMFQRQNKLKIKYIVCNSNASEIEPFKKKLLNHIDVKIANNLKECAKISQGTFPTFILLKNKKVIERWSNDQFGVRAKDFVENSVK